MSRVPPTRRVIQINKGIVAPIPPRPRSLRPRAAGEYPHVSPVYRDVAVQFASPLLGGPPICDELLAFVQHVFTEEEAALVRHLGGMTWRTADEIARLECRPVAEIQLVLEKVASQKRAIAGERRRKGWRYRLLPIVPGMFELVLIGESPETMSPWHRRFAELFEALFDTGYLVDYQSHPVPWVRFLPLQGLADSHPAALPCEKLEVVLDRFQTFGIGSCQCRMSANVVGKVCDKPLEVCAVMGDWAERGIQQGWLRSVSKAALLDIKREAESHGLVTWIMNIESTTGQASCSCCGCCCKAMRMVNDFNAPGVVAPPHFVPHFDETKCTYCGKCALTCPLGAITADTRGEHVQHNPVRCIGCGLCASACTSAQAIQMQQVPAYRLPYRSWLSFLLANGAAMLGNSWSVWRRRARKIDEAGLAGPQPEKAREC
jgi:Pyruvate/2-oxoacid:ferredoxin oxidoreductase delta subunit